MARGLDQRLADLRDACADPTSDAARRELRAALRSSTGALIAAAAHTVAAHHLEPLIGELPAAFARLCERPIKRDPGCRGKAAIARALHDLDRFEDDVFETGASFVQREPVWGGSEDTAAELRGICGYAYAHCGHPDALRVLAELLADPERAARAAAARALADAGRPDADALLRFKLLSGDPEPEVLSACFSSLLTIDPSGSLPFVERFLSAAAETAEAAVLALGESRLEGARAILIRWCEAAMFEEAQRVGYLALALLRSEAATGYLLAVIRAGPAPRAFLALEALAPFRGDATLAAAARDAAAENPDRAALAEARAQFPAPPESRSE